MLNSLYKLNLKTKVQQVVFSLVKKFMVLVFQCERSLDVPRQQLNNVRKFQHEHSDVMLFTKSITTG